MTDTLMASSVPLVGRVEADTLIASSVPLVGRAIVTDSLSKSPVRGLEGTLLTSLSLAVCSSDPVVLVTRQHWYFPGYLDITLPLSAWFKNVAILVAKVRLTCERNAHYAHNYKALMQKIYIQGSSGNKVVTSGLQSNTPSKYDDVLLGGGPVVGSRNNAKVWSYVDLCPYVVAGQLNSSKNYKFGLYIPAANI